MNLIKKIIAFVVLGTFSATQIASGQEYQLMGQRGAPAVKSATDQPAAAPEPSQNLQTSDWFLAEESALSPVESDVIARSEATKQSQSSGIASVLMDTLSRNDFEYERYEFKDAVDL